MLAPHGSLCFELGDTYSGSGGAGGDYAAGGLRDGAPAFDGSAKTRRTILAPTNRPGPEGRDRIPGWPLDKSLTLIPESFRWALAYGRNPFNGRTTDPWRVRNVVRWHRPNPPVGALGDKFRPATSDVVVACKSRTRYFDLDAVRGPGSANTHTRLAQRDREGTGSRRNNGKAAAPERGGNFDTLAIQDSDGTAPPLDTWVIPTAPYKGSHYACVDDQTEALTPDGWKRHDQLSDGDRIAAYDHDRGVITWQAATFHRYPYNGDLVVIEKRETSQRLTPNHRVLCQSQSGTVGVRRADELVSSNRVPVAAPFEVDGSGGPGVDRAALLGWYVTEGSERARKVHIYQSESANPKHVNRIRDLLDAVRADYLEARWRVRQSSISGRESIEVKWSIDGELARWLRSEAPSKTLSASVLGWSDDESGALLDALIDGDGHTRPSGRRQFIQKDRATIDTVQALCCRLGLRSTISQRKAGDYSLTIGERTWLSLRGANGASDPIRTEHYEGTVWCPSVPSTFWLARRNGRPFITGNTFPPDLVVKPIASMCPERVCTICGEPSRRVTGEPEYVDSHSVERGDAQTIEKRQWKDGELNRQGAVGANNGAHKIVTTLGWTECDCFDTDGTKWRRGVVLDPFAGSGTTLAVATGHGRDAIGIDIDRRNVALALDRVGMFLTVEESDEALFDLEGTVA